MNTRKAVRTITNDEAEAVYEGASAEGEGAGLPKAVGA